MFEATITDEAEAVPGPSPVIESITTTGTTIALHNPTNSTATTATYPLDSAEIDRSARALPPHTASTRSTR